MTRARMRVATGRLRLSRLGVLVAALALSLITFTSATATRGAAASCSPSATILESPRVGSLDVQAKGVNDRGDVVGFADSKGGSKPVHAILWKGGKVAGAVDLGVVPGYVASEAYGVNNDRVVFGLLYDGKRRAFPFRWDNGRMTVLNGPSGHPQATDNPGSGGRNAINARGEIAWADRGRRPTCRALDAGRQGDVPSRSARAHVDGCIQHQRRRHRVRLVAEAAERGR
jgi:probable HAF family extracellular repeat protein